MGFLQQLHVWAKGEIMQGRWMLAFGILLLPIVVVLIKSNNSLQRGMAIPIILLFAVQIGYGSYLLFSRARQALQIEKKFQENQQQTIVTELSESENESRTYILLKYAWGTFTIVSLIGYFVISTEYYKGLSLGFAVMFLALLCTDTFLHQRLNSHIQVMQKLVA